MTGERCANSSEAILHRGQTNSYWKIWNVNDDEEKFLNKEFFRPDIIAQLKRKEKR